MKTKYKPTDLMMKIRNYCDQYRKKKEHYTKMNREKIIEEALKRTPIEGLEWILEGDRFGFGVNWSENVLPECEEEWAGYYIQRAIDVLKQYQKADGFLYAHGWRWDGGEVE